MNLHNLFEKLQNMARSSSVVYAICLNGRLITDETSDALKSLVKTMHVCIPFLNLTVRQICTVRNLSITSTSESKYQIRCVK